MTKRIFAQKTSIWLTLLIILVGVFILMLLGRYTHLGQSVENKLSVVAWPLQEMVAAPSAEFKKVVGDLQGHEALIQQNKALQRDNFMLRTKVQRLTSIENQNKELRSLLMSSQQVDGKVRVAHILAVNLAPSLQQMIVNSGSHDHAFVNQPVLDAFGVMGQLVTIQPKVSRVLLLTDPKSAIPVKDVRSGVRAIAVGAGHDQIKLINVTDTADIKPGDLMVTSGLGMQFPFGYPVGIVQKVIHTPQQNFAKITLKPSAHLDQSNQVLLVWPKRQALAPAVENMLTSPLTKNEKKHSKQ
jgi:rod shape-determining protein MreC